ncbi:MAG: hypothetical protein HWE18_10520 [Gammaproteobacteria bacterium]|nr:hypothetical protein [Gammaproteobacteria bacterium]
MKIKDAKIYPLSDIAKLAQAQIQQDFPELDPIIGISHNLRNAGFAADTLTIDNIRNDKRIVMIVFDDQPEQVQYEYCRISQDPNFEFTIIALNDLTQDQFYAMMVEALN